MQIKLQSLKYHNSVWFLLLPLGLFVGCSASKLKHKSVGLNDPVDPPIGSVDPPIGPLNYSTVFYPPDLPIYLTKNYLTTAYTPDQTRPDYYYLSTSCVLPTRRDIRLQLSNHLPLRHGGISILPTRPPY